MHACIIYWFASDPGRVLGFSEEESNVMTDVILYAQLRGNNQGVIKVTTGSLRPNPARTSWSIEHETKLSARVNLRSI